VAEIVARLWQTKLRSISLLEDWLPQTSDFGIRAGLQSHLGEERRHQRILGAEITRRGGRRGAAAVGHVLDRPFDLVRDQTDDLERVRLFHQGIKACTVLYCERFLPLLDPGLAHVLEQITRDEQRHIRWAEIRLSQEDTGKRRPDPFLAEIEAAMEAVWSRPWRRLSLAGYGVGKAG
jgi:rubrerythrin